jgi:hypothetical protein
MTSAKVVLEKLRPRAEATLSSLQAQPYEVLLRLPAVSPEEIEDAEKKAVLTTYRDILPDGRLLVVVQLMVSGILGSARIWARGFSIGDGQSPVHASEEQLFDFL